MYQKKLFLFFLISNYSYSDILFVDGSSKNHYSNIILHYEIHLEEIENNEFKFQLSLPNNFTNGTNRQIISNLNIKSYPQEKSYKIFQDNLKNDILELTYLTKKRNIDINISFSTYNDLEIPFIKNINFYPIHKEDINHIEEYLLFTELTKPNKEMENLVQNLLKDIYFQEMAILKILVWVKENIKEDHFVDYEDSINSFEYRIGNQNGILNLILSFLKIAKIPCRIAKGFSMKKKFIFPLLEKNFKENHFLKDYLLNFPFNQNFNFNIEFSYKKSLYQWLEVYFPYRDWTSFDPFMSLFFIPTNLIRKSIHLDSKNERDRLIINNEITNINYLIFSSPYQDSNEINIIGSSSIKNYFFMFPNITLPILNTLESFYSKKETGSFSKKPIEKDPEVEILDKNIRPILALEPKNLKFIKNDAIESSDIDIEIKNNEYLGQEIELKNLKSIEKIEKISLAIFKFSDYLQANQKIEIEVYTKNELIGKSENFILTTKKINYENYQWADFYFPSPIEIKKIKNDTILILIKSNLKNQTLFLKGILGNSFQNKKDTFRITSLNNKPTLNYLYLDLCFKIF